MSDTKTTEDKREEQTIADEFEGLDNDLVNVGKFADPNADPGSSDASEDNAESQDQSKNAGLDGSEALKPALAPALAQLHRASHIRFTARPVRC